MGDQSDDDLTKLYASADEKNRLGDENEARRLYKEASLLDPTSLPVHLKILESSTNKYHVRRKIASFCAEHITDLQRDADEKMAHRGNDASKIFKPKIFVYWAQGFSNAPAIVQACHREMQRLHESDEVVFLTDENLHEWIDIPEWLNLKLAQRKTFFADVLRMLLLARHGGIWVDATVYVRESLIQNFENWCSSGYFALYGVAPGRYSNWLLASRPNGRVPVLMQGMLLAYWAKYNKPITYFFFHHIMETIYFLDEEVHAICDAMPRLSGFAPRRIQAIAYRPTLNPKLMARYRSLGFHKISYKKIRKNFKEPGTLYSAILNADYKVLGDC